MPPIHTTSQIKIERNTPRSLHVYIPEISDFIRRVFFFHEIFFVQNALADETRAQTISSCMDSNKISDTISAIFGLYVQQILNDFNKIKENMSNSRSKFRTNFLVTPTRKTDRAIVLKLLSVIHSRLKVDSFELLIDGVILSVL